MRIQTLLNEDFAPDAPASALSFNDLNTLQVRTLQRIASGEVDVDTADEKEYDIMADLAELGLLDDEYALSERGAKAVAIAKRLGGSAEVVAARRKQGKLDAFDASGEQYDPDADDDLPLQGSQGIGGDEFGEDEYAFPGEDDALAPRRPGL